MRQTKTSVPNKEMQGLDAPRVWDVAGAFEHLQTQGLAYTKRTAERQLQKLGFLPVPLTDADLQDEEARPLVAMVLAKQLTQARAKRQLVLFAQLHDLPGRQACLHANDARGARYWMPLGTAQVHGAQVARALAALQVHVGKEVAVFPSGPLVGLCRQVLAQDPKGLPGVSLLAYPPVLNLAAQQGAAAALRTSTPHLRRLEAESIHIIREAVAEAENPAMLYSVGKDSGVMLHLARKAFFPSPPPFPLLHVDTRWEFQEIYLFRDYMARASGMDLLVYTNPKAIAKDINPFDHGSALHTNITKTEGLKQALDKYKFDVVFGGARRDEEKSRAKERIFSFRSATHRWEPKAQRPELWSLFNTRKAKGESIRVFPLSNWTELDIWQYIWQENIPVVPLYFAKERAVVVRDGMILLVDDNRFRLLPGEEIQAMSVRFRTLGCYPLTGGVASNAASLQDIVLEIINARSSERQGRAIDKDAVGSMEEKKKQGYF